MARGGGLTKPHKLSDELAAICGVKVASRASCMKHLWAYLKKNNLQDPANKQYFTPDKKMAKVFGTDKIRGFGMAKYIGTHLLEPVDEDEEVDDEKENKKTQPKKPQPKKKQSKKEESEDEESEGEQSEDEKSEDEEKENKKTQPKKTQPKKTQPKKKQSKKNESENEESEDEQSEDEQSDDE